MIEEFEDGFVKTHSILNLYDKIKTRSQFAIDLKLLEKINDIYKDTRYPSNLGLLPYSKPTIETAKEFYKLARKVFDKVKDFLEKE